jgi:hypothetical protein
MALSWAPNGKNCDGVKSDSRECFPHIANKIRDLYGKTGKTLDFLISKFWEKVSLDFFYDEICCKYKTFIFPFLA